MIQAGMNGLFPNRALRCWIKHPEQAQTCVDGGAESSFLPQLDQGDLNGQHAASAGLSTHLLVVPSEHLQLSRAHQDVGSN